MSGNIIVPEVKTERQANTIKKKCIGVVKGLIAVRDEKRNIDDVALAVTKLRKNAVKTPREQFLTDVDTIIGLDVKTLPNPNMLGDMSNLKSQLREVFGGYARPTSASTDSKSAALDDELNELLSLIS